MIGAVSIYTGDTCSAGLEEGTVDFALVQSSRTQGCLQTVAFRGSKGPGGRGSPSSGTGDTHCTAGPLELGLGTVPGL